MEKEEETQIFLPGDRIPYMIVGQSRECSDNLAKDFQKLNSACHQSCTNFSKKSLLCKISSIYTPRSYIPPYFPGFASIHERLYTPMKDDVVIAIVASKSSDFFMCDIRSENLASLSTIGSFEMATKRNRPNISVGTCVLCRVCYTYNMGNISGYNNCDNVNNNGDKNHDCTSRTSIIHKNTNKNSLECDNKCGQLIENCDSTFTSKITPEDDVRQAFTQGAANFQPGALNTRLSCKLKDCRRMWSAADKILGPLSSDNSLVADIPIGIAKSLLCPRNYILQQVGKYLKYEICVGVNGRLWIRAEDPRDRLRIYGIVVESYGKSVNNMEAIVEKFLNKKMQQI